MFCKFLKKVISIMLISLIFFGSVVERTFAIVDITIPTKYSITQDEVGNKFFSSSSTTIKPGLDLNAFCSGDGEKSKALKDLCVVNGDLSIEWTNPNCQIYAASYIAAMYVMNIPIKIAATLTLMGTAAIIFARSSDEYQDIEICGADWLVWGTHKEGDTTVLENFNKYYPELGAFGGSKKYDVIKCIQNFEYCEKKCRGKANCMVDLNFMANQNNRRHLNVRDKAYRERYYNGQEIINEGCFDPREEAREYDINQSRISGNKTPFQTYYMKGFDHGNYACDRFNNGSDNENDVFYQAYKCCLDTSKKVCIFDKRKNKATFCDSRNNSLCSIPNGRLSPLDNLIVKITNSIKGSKNQYCVETYSLCPYNFNLQKGTEKTMSFKKTISGLGENISVNDECFDKAKNESLSCQGRIKNFHQYNRHCTIVQEWKGVPNDHFNYPSFLDKACINSVGSSHNTEGYASYKGYVKNYDNYKIFTASTVECLTETVKNFLFNKTGHTKCANIKNGIRALPDQNGLCDEYLYKEGDDMLLKEGIQAPSLKLLKFIRSLIMMAVILMVTLYGYNIMINFGALSRKDLMINLLKIVIVISFSSGSWWYDQIYKFTFGFANTFSNLTSKIGFDATIDSKNNYIKYDGCYFGDVNSVLGKKPGEENPNIDDNRYYNYPADRAYMAMFDTLDCKIHKYLGYSVGKNVSSLLTFLAATFIWPFSLYLGVATFLMALFVINFAIKTAYIFIASSLALTMMLYLAPLIIPCILFKKTKGIFDGWLKNTISFALQPMVLFAFVSVSINIMDRYVLGDGIYKGNGLHKELVCGYACLDSNSNAVLEYTEDRTGTARQNIEKQCKDKGKVIDLKRTSLLCFMSNMTTTSFSIFHSIGIFIPLVVDIFESDKIMFLRVAFLFFILTTILKTIPGIAAHLTGGVALPGTDAGDPFATIQNIKNGAQALKNVARVGVNGVGKFMSNKIKNFSGGKNGGDSDKDKDGKEDSNRTSVSGNVSDVRTRSKKK